jgi:hypothetical protein
MPSGSVYVAVSNPRLRARIVAALAREGRVAIELPTGFHVLAAIADVIDGNSSELPAKIIIDELARGCTGASLAAGLRALGVAIPVELVRPEYARREAVQAVAP